MVVMRCGVKSGKMVRKKSDLGIISWYDLGPG